ncbi:MAG: DUF1573 domain-containing protein [Muribaculaceae bacterium]|nr:DUF1573 domain-containing protein [Muribaculaceae bacterium]
MMARRIFISLILSLIASIAFPEFISAKSGPAITLREKSYDFGIVAENGGPISHEFEFKNTGTEPLIIVSATASCGCTRPTYPTAPIKPGETGKIKVTYLPAGRPGEFNKAVKIRTNAKSTKKFSLKISGTVKPDIKK